MSNISTESISNSSIKYTKQWVSNVISFSSQYNSTTWAANKVVGPPMAYPGYGDMHNTWAQGTYSRNEFIELEFPQELIVTKLNIYETFHAGAVVQIKLRNKDNWESVYGPVRPQDIHHSRIFSPELKKTKFKTNRVRLELDCTCANTWCEIDAVEMEGKVPLNPSQCEEDLANDLKKLLNSKDFFDVEFKVEGKTLEAHRNILAARSQYFKVLLCENLKSNRLTKPIHIEHISYNAFKLLLNYLYTNRIEQTTTPDIACELLRKIDVFNIESFKISCIDFIEDILNKNNVLEVYKSSALIEPELNDIKELSLKFISSHFQDIVQKREFKELPQKNIILITQYYAKSQQN